MKEFLIMKSVLTNQPEIYNYDDVTSASSIAYHTLKGGLINMTKHMAVYWAKDKIRVNCLSPGAFPKSSIKETFKKRFEIFRKNCSFLQNLAKSAKNNFLMEINGN